MYPSTPQQLTRKVFIFRYGKIEDQAKRPFFAFIPSTLTGKHPAKTVETQRTLLQTATAATTLPTSRVGGNRSNVLDSADSHTGTGEGAESGLSTGSGGLGAVTCID